MTIAVAIEKDDEKAMRSRKCIVTGEVRDDAHLVRFVVSPDGDVVPDIAAKLPGRGMWVSADRATLERAIAKNHFSKAAKANVKASADLPALVEKQIAQRMLNDLGLAKRSGALILGFDNVARALESAGPLPVLIEAADGARDGKRKLYAVAHARGEKPQIVECLTKAELSLALGRENVIHAALKAGALAERLIFEAGRLSGFRAVKTDAGQKTVPGPAHEGIA
ncbi:MAG TPA: RNA-binding protein [Rhizomicrobium sp.]|nr:RNA-binding protein [Rhizomicrobium sp.]